MNLAGKFAKNLGRRRSVARQFTRRNVSRTAQNNSFGRESAKVIQKQIDRVRREIVKNEVKKIFSPKESNNYQNNKNLTPQKKGLILSNMVYRKDYSFDNQSFVKEIFV